MLPYHGVLVADILRHLRRVRMFLEIAVVGVCRGERVLVLYRDFDLQQRSIGDAADALHQMSLFGVWLHAAEQPGFIIEPDRIPQQRVALPAADRVAVPTRDRG